MDIKRIKALAQLLKDADLNVLEICEGETRIRLEKTAPVAVVQNERSPKLIVNETDSCKEPVSIPSEVDFNNIKEVHSPMVGVFYSAPAEDAAPYVKIGDKVKKGDVLCIIEAMKLMNEICAEEDGEIVDICAENGKIIEYGQTIFKMF